MRIFTCGSRSRICAVASIPERRGMRTSIRTTSGIRSWAFSTASWPSDASPTSSSSSSLPRTISRPRRNKAWSSTTITRSRSPSLFVTPGSFRRCSRLRPCVGLGVSYGTLPVRRSLLTVMVTELPFELGAHQIDRRGHLVSFGMCAEGLSRDPQRGLDPFEPARAGMVLVGHLDLEDRGAGLDPSERRELVLGHAADRIGDLQAASRERHLHVPGPPSRDGLSSG